MRCWLEKTTSTADGFSTPALLIVISVCYAAHTEAGVVNRPQVHTKTRQNNTLAS